MSSLIEQETFSFLIAMCDVDTREISDRRKRILHREGQVAFAEE
jgi:hypothetical protein